MVFNKTREKRKMKGYAIALGQTIIAAALILPVTIAEARDVRYSGGEQSIYVKPGEPTQVNFPGEIDGGFRRKHSRVNIERQGNYLVVFAQPDLSPEGEALLVHLKDKRTYSIRVLPSSDLHPRDEGVTLLDERVPEIDIETSGKVTQKQPRDFAPPTVVSGLMREMVLVAEFGKKKGIPGYRRSNRYTGETILHDGTIVAKIDEIFMGPDLWGYVLDVENLQGVQHKLNPASFRLDGTRAISADNWDLAPRPETAEQTIADKHRAKVYVVTRSKRR